MAAVVADVVDGDDVGVIAEAAHRLRLAAHAHPPGVIKPLRLDDGEGDVAAYVLVS